MSRKKDQEPKTPMSFDRPEADTVRDALPDKAKEKYDELPDEVKGIAAEFPDFAEIIAGANYDRKGPEVVDPDPAMRYYLAAPDDIKGRSDGVSAVERLGYKRSEKQVVNPADDCVLMETPWRLYDYRMKLEQAERRKKLHAVKRHVEHGTAVDGQRGSIGGDGLEVLRDRSPGDGMGPGFRKLG